MGLMFHITGEDHGVKVPHNRWGNMGLKFHITGEDHGVKVPHNRWGNMGLKFHITCEIMGLKHNRWGLSTHREVVTPSYQLDMGVYSM